MSVINLGISPIIAGQGLVFSGAVLNVNVANSLIISGDAIRLVNDQGSPGASRYYGTDVAGNKGWHILTGAGGGGSTGDVTSAQLTATGQVLGAKIDSLSGYSDSTFATIPNLAATGQTLWNASQGNATNLSGNLTATGAALIARDAAISGGLEARIALTGQTAWTHGQNNATNLSGRLTATGAALIQRDLDISGALVQRITAAANGVSTLNALSGVLNILGTGTVTVTTNGQNIIVSGASGAGGGSAGQAQLSPGFTYATGGVVNLSVDNTKASQNLEIRATGDVILNVSSSYDGANGTVIIYKTFAGTGSLTLPSGAVIANGLGATVMPLSTGASGYDFASFIYDNARSYWAISTLSGVSNVSAGGGGTGTRLSVTGSSFLATANIIAIGSASAYISGGNTIVISGGAIGTGGGGAGDVTQAQLLATSGDLLNRPQLNLNGGTVLTGNVVYYDGFNANRILTFAGASNPGAFITLRANVSGTYTLNFPSSYRAGEQGATTGITIPPGNQEISWIRADNKWWMLDSASAISISAPNGPTNIDDQRSGYGAGASYWFDSTVSGLYVCLNAATSGAAWYRINSPTGVFASSIILNGQTLTTTGSSLYVNGVLVSGGGGGAGGTGTQVSVTGSAFLPIANFIGVGGTMVWRSGLSTIVVSGASGAGGSVGQSQLSPGFVYATGGVVNLTVNSSKTVQNLEVTATGNVILNISGPYDGCAGTVIIYKTYGGTGSLTPPAGSVIINGLGATTIPLSTGASGYDAVSFVYDVNRPYWAVSTLSGFASTSTVTQTGNYTALTVTGSSVLPGVNVIAIGGALAYLSGASTLVISGGAGSSQGTALGGVTGVNGITGGVSVVGAGTVAVTTAGQVITVSGQTSSALYAPAFVYYTGGVVIISGDPAKAAQNARITATGNIILNLTGVYDGMNGVIAITKTYVGTGSVTLSSNSYVVNAPLNTTIIPLSTGSGIIDAISFIHDNTQPIWAVSTLSGFASVSAGGGGTGTNISVTGSSILGVANFIGVGGAIVWRSGLSTVVVSGGAGGGAGDVTQAQLNAVSGFFQTPPQIDLNGGTSLLVNTSYFDDFSSNRTLTFGGSPSAGSSIVLRANITDNIVLTVPSSYRIGQFSTVTALPFTPGNHEISWIYADSKWWMADSSNTASTAVLRVTGNFTVTGGNQFGYVWSGDPGVTQTGTLAGASSLSGYQILVKNITTGSSLLLSGSIDYSQNLLVTSKQSVTLWSDNSSWLIV